MLKWYSWVPRILQTLAWVPTRLLLAGLCRFQVSGIENLKGLRQAIFAVNHASELDPIILTAALSPIGRFSPMFYIVAPEKEFDHERFGWRRHIYFGTFFKAWGAYPTPMGLRNYARTLANHVAILQDGGSVCVFPEGGITPDGTLQRGHGGISYLAHVSCIPIVPVYINGTYKVDVSAMFHRERTILLRFGAPLFAKDILPDVPNPAIEDYKKGAQVVMNRIGKLLH